MAIRLRTGTPADAEDFGQIIYDAFVAITGQHNFPSDFPAPEAGIGVASMLLSHPGFYCVVAEDNGTIVGSNFLDERGTVAGLGPITVSPSNQNSGVGRHLIQHMLDRATERKYPGVRLLQAAYHTRSLALYASLNFDVREICSVLQGPRVQVQIPGCTVRATTDSDLERCNRLCNHVHGHDRGGEVSETLYSRDQGWWWSEAAVSRAIQRGSVSSAIQLVRLTTMYRHSSGRHRSILGQDLSYPPATPNCSAGA